MSALLWVALVGGLQAQNALQIDSVDVYPSDGTATVAVAVDVDRDLSLLNLHISYDHQWLQISGAQIATETSRLHDSSASATIVSIDEGMVKWTLGKSKGFPVVLSGSGPLLYLTFDFHPECPLGTFPLTWARVEAFDSKLNTLEFSVKEDGAITVKEAADHTVTYEAGPNGVISGEALQTVEDGGDTTPVEAVPDTGYHFTQWSDGIADNPRADYGVTADIHVVAQFAPEVFDLTFAAGSNGSIDGPAAQTVAYGEDAIAVTAVPDQAWMFARWLLDGSEYAADNPLVLTDVTDHLSLTAEFAPKPHDADQDADWQIDLSPELTRLVQFVNSGGYHEAPGTEDGYAPGPGTKGGKPHDADQDGDWHIDLSPDLSRIIQFVNSDGYHCEPGTEDGYAPGPPAAKSASIAPATSERVHATWTVGPRSGSERGIVVVSVTLKAADVDDLTAVVLRIGLPERWAFGGFHGETVSPGIVSRLDAADQLVLAWLGVPSTDGETVSLSFSLRPDERNRQTSSRVRLTGRLDYRRQAGKHTVSLPTLLVEP